MSQVYVGNSSEVNPPIPVPDLHVARFIVSPGDGTDGANYTTIASAIAAAVTAGGNQTVFIQPGTYTENLTLVAGINLTAFDCDALTPNVIIVGKMTATFSGTASLSGLRLQTNSDYLLEITGANPTFINLDTCYLNCSNHTGIHCTAASADVTLTNCSGNLGTTLIGYHLVTAGEVGYIQCNMSNSGNSVTPSNASAGGVVLEQSTFVSPLSSSGTGVLGVYNSIVDCGQLNTTPVAFAGSVLNHCINSVLDSGTAVGVTIGTGSSLELDLVHIQCTNVHLVTGLGTLFYGFITIEDGGAGDLNSTTVSANLSYVGNLKANSLTLATPLPIVDGGTGVSSFGTSHGIVVYDGTDLVNYGGPQISTAGIQTNTTQPSFLAYLSSSDSNSTGDGTTVQVPFDTVVYDVGSHFTTGASAHYTFPVTGKYLISVQVEVFNTNSSNFTLGIVASSRSFQNINSVVAATDVCQTITALIDATAADTVNITATLSGGTKSASVLGTGSPYFTYVSGYLVC